MFQSESVFGKELEDYKVIVTAEKPGISELEVKTEAEVPQEIQSEI